MLLAALLMFQGPASGINYHLDYELDQTTTTFKNEKESVETGTLTHEFGLKEGQERYTYVFKSPGDKLDVFNSVRLVADAKADDYVVYRVIDKAVTTEKGKKAYDQAFKVTRHNELFAGDDIDGPETTKPIAGVPCDRLENLYFNIASGFSVKCIYWYPIDRKKAKRVGWLEVEMYTKEFQKTMELQMHVKTTKIRFGTITPAEGG